MRSSWSSRFPNSPTSASRPSNSSPVSNRASDDAITCAAREASPGPAPRIVNTCSASRSAGDPELEPRDFLELLRGGEDPAAGLPRGRLSLGGRRQIEEKAPAELVVVRLVGLDRLFVESRGRLVAALATEGDERGVAHEGERFAGELPGGD